MIPVASRVAERLKAKHLRKLGKIFIRFRKKTFAISVVYSLQVVYCSFSEGIHLLFGVA